MSYIIGARQEGLRSLIVMKDIKLVKELYIISDLRTRFCACNFHCKGLDFHNFILFQRKERTYVVGMSQNGPKLT